MTEIDVFANAELLKDENYNFLGGEPYEYTLCATWTFETKAQRDEFYDRIIKAKQPAPGGKEDER